jgi:hypothetical protein
MKKTKLLTFAALIALLLTSFMPFSAFAVTVPSFTLSPSSNQLQQFQYVLPSGTTFNGSVSTTGDVQVWVNSPEAEIVNLGIIDKTTAFSFVAQQNGTYIVNFENDMSNTIQVTFSYVTNPVIPGSNSSGVNQTYLGITAIIAVLGSLLIIFVLHRKETRSVGGHKTAPANTSSYI